MARDRWQCMPWQLLVHQLGIGGGHAAHDATPPPLSRLFHRSGRSVQPSTRAHLMHHRAPCGGWCRAWRETDDNACQDGCWSTSSALGAVVRPKTVVKSLGVHLAAGRRRTMIGLAKRLGAFFFFQSHAEVPPAAPLWCLHGASYAHGWGRGIGLWSECLCRVAYHVASAAAGGCASGGAWAWHLRPAYRLGVAGRGRVAHGPG